MVDFGRQDIHSRDECKSIQSVEQLLAAVYKHFVPK